MGCQGTGTRGPGHSGGRRARPTLVVCTAPPEELQKWWEQALKAEGLNIKGGDVKIDVIKVPPPPAGARRASPEVPPGERGCTRSHLGPRLTCGRGRRGPSGGSPPRRGPPGGRLRGLAAHGRGGGRGWLPASALPRPGGRGRSVGAARRTHLAGSHPSARRGARRERGPGRRGQAALTGRTAEAPARRRSALRPSRAGRAPCPGDEEASAPPAQIAAAAGRLLHCLTTRAGFSPRLPAPREGGGGDPGDSRRKEDTGDVAVVTAKRQLKILESVYRRLSEEFVEAWCPPETCKSKRYISLEDKRASSSRSKKETGVIPM
ncbi:5E5 antigen-like [Prionailurus viverrinus]|uniref:5E5 antigen-like n=1 Tax=Prionailurus viverrinus TaxID=61388 RepID=UPI001FF5F7AC|nr:5E5 antigen-like [Prionailurus viverrinus]